MQELISKIKDLQKSPINQTVESRLQEFASFKGKNGGLWFSELCFCILTANSRARTGITIQNQLGPSGFLFKTQEEIMNVIIQNHHRFHNNKSKYIVQARKHAQIKKIVNDFTEKGQLLKAREWIVKNIKGIGYKEASHFLRNTGHEDLAILDRHILNLMAEHNLIERPKTLSPKLYIDIESKFNNIAHNLQMSPAKLDLFMWYMKTGEILK